MLAKKRNIFAIRLFLALVLTTHAAGTVRASAPLIEVEIGDKKLQGRVETKSKLSFWLMGQDGRLLRLASADVKKFRQVSPQFSSWTQTILRGQLQREWGKSFDVVTSRHYVICATGEKKAQDYAATFEEFFRSFQAYFSARGFKIDEPEFPLVAIVFPDKQSYARYAEAEGMPISKYWAYYNNTSNRIALYEVDAAATGDLRLQAPRGRQLLSPSGVEANLPFWQQSDRDGQTRAFRLFGPGSEMDDPGSAWGTVAGSLKNVMVHEATHQAAFNCRLHSRISGNPRWVVEGLATVFEAPGIRNSAANSGIKMRINPERFIHFGNYTKSRRKPRSLESFLSNDDAFDGDLYDAYSEAWALSFFLIETRPRPYAEYLRAMATRNHLRPYTAADRVTDFKRTVSKELPHLETEFLDFMSRIK